MLYRALPASEHELVEMRLIAEGDLADWYAFLSLPTVHEHTSWNLTSPSDLAHYPGVSASATAESLLRASGKLIGTAGFHSVWPQDRRVEVAYDLSPEYWGRGIITYVCSLLVQWAHTDTQIMRVQATVLKSNLRSVGVLERCGFSFEGVLRSYRFVRGVPGNFCMYAHVRP